MLVKRSARLTARQLPGGFGVFAALVDAACTPHCILPSNRMRLVTVCSTGCLLLLCGPKAYWCIQCTMLCTSGHPCAGVSALYC